MVLAPLAMGSVLAGAMTAIRRKSISDPEPLRAVMPDYTVGCKRIVPSNRWYPALAKPNVELVTGALREVRGSTVIASDGAEREVDTIILGTGYHVTDIPFASHVRGVGGALLQDAWEGSPRAYLGTSIPGFPNFFMLLGPNIGLGHSSMVYMIESQVDHVLGALAAMERDGATTIEARATSTRSTTASWTRGCDGPCGSSVAAPASTSIRRDATPRCGRTGPGASAVSPADLRVMPTGSRARRGSW